MTDPHADSADAARLGALEAGERIASGGISSVQLVSALIARAEAIDAAGSPVSLRSLAAIAPDALEAAARLDEEIRRGTRRGPLHGVPVVVKDNIEAKGLPGAAGSTALLGRPATDSPIVERLHRAGALVLAATNLSEWANIRSSQSTSGWSATGGLVANPWALDRSAGGSSSGSGAALAAGLAPLAVGTETDGSIVCPASLNGVVGLKPTVGVVPTRGVVPISASQDSPGPMARTVDDAAALFSILSGETPAALGREPRLAVATDWTCGHPATDAVVVSVIEQLRGAGLVTAERTAGRPGETEGGDELTVMLCELFDDLGAYLSGRAGPGPTTLAEVLAHEEAHRDVEMPFFGHDLFEQAVGLGGRCHPTYGPARARNLEWATKVLNDALRGVDALIAPAYGPAWKSDLVVGGHPGHVASPATMAPAIAGWPILSVPIGFVHGLPVGLAMVGRPHDEWALLAAARSVESVVGPLGTSTPSWRPPSGG